MNKDFEQFEVLQIMTKHEDKDDDFTDFDIKPSEEEPNEN